MLGTSSPYGSPCLSKHELVGQQRSLHHELPSCILGRGHCDNLVTMDLSGTNLRHHGVASVACTCCLHSTCCAVSPFKSCRRCGRFLLWTWAAIPGGATLWWEWACGPAVCARCAARRNLHASQHCLRSGAVSQGSRRNCRADASRSCHRYVLKATGSLPPPAWPAHMLCPIHTTYELKQIAYNAMTSALLVHCSRSCPCILSHQPACSHSPKTMHMHHVT